MKAGSFLIFLFASQYIYLCSCQCDTESNFQCNNEICIPKTKLCNGMSDCSNSEDEANCDFQKCGQSGNAGNVKQNNLQSRIVGGVDAVDGAWPWHALITRYSRRKIGKTPVTFKDRYIIGGASLINNYWVLTAAHVFGNSRIRLSNYIITLGISKKPDKDEGLPSSAQMFWPGKIVKYPDYSTQIYNNDIALIKLGVEIDVVTMRQKSSVINGATYSYFVRPVCLPCGRNCMDEKNFVDKRGNSLLNNEMTAEEKCSVEESILYKSDSKVVVTGFGNTRKTDLSRYRFKPSIRLQEATLKILDKYKCILGINSINEVLGGGNIAYSDKYICCNPAESKKSVDACQGDSGGPVVKEVVNEDTGEPCWVQVGIVSFGYGCGLEFPGFYSNVAKFVGWINSTILIP